MTDRSADSATELEAIAGHVLDLVTGHAGEHAEAIVTAARTHHGLTRFANSYVHQHVGEDRTEVSLKLALDGRVLSSETSNVERDALDRLVRTAVDQAALLPVDRTWPGVNGPQDLHAAGMTADDTWQATPDDRADHVQRFIAEGDELRAAGFVDTSADAVVIATTGGGSVNGRATRATIDGIHQSDDAAGYGHRTSRSIGELDGGAVGARAADLARRSSGADPLEPGEYEVVLAPECVAEMLSFLSFYGFNAKQHEEGQSFARPGEGQFDPTIALVDDATDGRAIGLPFDAEGTPKRPVTLIDAGVTASLVHDRRTAARAGTETTGHAVPGGDAWGALPRNLFLAPGPVAPADLVAGIERGLLVTQFNYVRILDPKSQVATGLTRNGTFLIENGVVQRPVDNLRFTQSFLEALGPGNVVALGDDARFAACEFGNGLVHCPSAHLARFRFTGGAAG